MPIGYTCGSLAFFQVEFESILLALFITYEKAKSDKKLGY